MTDFIPLLSGKALREFTPEEFKEHVRSLYYKPEPKKAAPKRKSQSELSVRTKVKKNGKLSLVTKRKPKYITQEEFDAIAQSLEWTKNDLFIAVKELDVSVREHEVSC